MKLENDTWIDFNNYVPNNLVGLNAKYMDIYILNFESSVI